MYTPQNCNMMPTSIEWDCDSHPTRSIGCESKRTISSTTISMEFNEEEKMIIRSCVSQVSSTPTHQDPPRQEPSRHELSERSWDIGVEELVVSGHNELSPSALRRMLDRTYKPETKTEAFECLRNLDEWSDYIEASCSRTEPECYEEESEKQQKRNTKLLRMRGSQLRRRLYAYTRESSITL